MDKNRGLGCTRAVAEQHGDRSGTQRSEDHPSLCRLELLADDELEELRARFPRTAGAALDFDDYLGGHEAEERDELRGSSEAEQVGEGRAILTVVVCRACGAFDVATDRRAWDVERAMARAGISERGVRRLDALLTRCFAGAIAGPTRPRLDELSADQLRALQALGDEPLPRHVRALFGPPSSEVRLTREGALRELARRRDGSGER